MLLMPFACDLSCSLLVSDEDFYFWVMIWFASDLLGCLLLIYYKVCFWLMRWFDFYWSSGCWISSNSSNWNSSQLRACQMKYLWEVSSILFVYFEHPTKQCIHACRIIWVNMTTTTCVNILHLPIPKSLVSIWEWNYGVSISLSPTSLLGSYFSTFYLHK